MLQNERSLEMTRQKHQTEYVVRCLFERVGDASFVGHLDLMHTFDRAIRRADMPILYTQGYNPRPMMVFALPLGVGIDTLGDFVDVSLSRVVDANEFMEKVNPNLPRGVKLYGGVNIDEPKNSLMSVVTVAMYRLEAPGIKAPMMRLFEKEELMIEKKSKGKIVTTDIRALLLSGAQNPSPDENVFEFYCLAGSTKNLRPDVLLNALCKYEGYDEDLALNTRVTRLALYGGTYPELKDIKELF
ncbi:MAG: DUF2344 domain-containing protein [Clostridiales bacterium]|nr:DUF2344 domain-containing protein [Clostridiales bacterium]